MPKKTNLPILIWIIFIVIQLINACTSLKETTPSNLSNDPTQYKQIPSSTHVSSEEVIIATTPSVIPTPTPIDVTEIPQQESYPKTHYKITAELDYDLHTLLAEEIISYFNNSPDTLPEVVLMVESNRYPNTFNLLNLSINDNIPVSNYLLEDNQLLVPLDQSLSPGESIKISIEYELNLPSPSPTPETRPIPFGYTSRQTNLVDWYPYIPPYFPGQGWLAHNPWFYGEHQVYDIANFQVNIRLLGNRPDLTIAASTPARQEDEWFHFEHNDARSFDWSVSHIYESLSDKIGDVIVISYFFPFDRSAGEAALRTTVESLTLYQDLFGQYPRKTLSIVEADFLDGLECDGMYFLSYGFYNSFTGNPNSYLIAIAAHETAHQWWFARVGNDQALEPWLDEAMCTYSERLYYEYYQTASLDWWWQYRIYYYEPQGYINRTIYEQGGYRGYRDSVYLNGAIFFEDLRKMIGDDEFFSFLFDYVDQQSLKLSTTDIFFDILQQHTAKEITELIQVYFK